MMQVFPTLPGLAWSSTKAPMFSTGIKTAVSGIENRASYWSLPRWKFTLSYEVLRAASQYTELQTLVGFFLQQGGQFSGFLYTDPTDNTVTGQGIGTGDGSNKTFQLVRTLGGFVEPMKWINGTPVIKVGGVVQSSGYSISNGLVTFTAAPANAAVVTADFSYYFKCRFALDSSEFELFMANLWSAKKIELLSLKS